MKLLGCYSDRDGTTLHALPKGLFSLFLMMWKFIILSFTQIDTDGAKYSHDRVWRLTLDRFRERCNAMVFAQATHSPGLTT